MNKWDKLFIDIALRMSEMSKSTRLKVGAVAVKDGHILCTSYNGAVSNYGDDVLEDEEGNTKPDVIHAEENILCQAALHGISLRGATLYITHNPCRGCSSKIAQSGIFKVKYLLDYRDQSGIEKLKQYEIKVEKLNYESN